MRIGSLFSGVGGLELGLELAGLGEVVWQVEQSKFCRDVLAKHWPDSERFEDVKEVGSHNLAPVDLICGGFPCQDISSAGKGKGLAGSRSGLWFEYARVIQELRPSWVVVENVASGAKRWVDQVTSYLGELDYETLPVPLSAEDVGAPHQRKRIFLIAHSERIELREQSRGIGGSCGEGPAQLAEHGKAGAIAHTSDDRREIRESCGSTEEIPTIKGAGICRPITYTYRDGESTRSEHEQVGRLRTPAKFGGWGRGAIVSPVCGVDDGIPKRVDRLRALGNAVVPQCAEVIGCIIRELESRE